MENEKEIAIAEDFRAICRDIASTGRWLDRVRKQPGTPTYLFLENVQSELMRHLSNVNSLLGVLDNKTL